MLHSASLTEITAMKNLLKKFSYCHDNVNSHFVTSFILHDSLSTGDAHSDKKCHRHNMMNLALRIVISLGWSCIPDYTESIVLVLYIYKGQDTSDCIFHETAWWHPSCSKFTKNRHATWRHYSAECKIYLPILSTISSFSLGSARMARTISGSLLITAFIKCVLPSWSYRHISQTKQAY